MCKSSLVGSDLGSVSYHFLGTALVILAGCSGIVATPANEPASQEKTTEVLRLATTSSTRDAGLMDELLPVFERAHRCRVKLLAVGTGAALALGEAGDVDVVLVHARKAEMAFMLANHGIRHDEFMFNNFVLLGPPDDPCMIRGADPVEAMNKIAKGKHRFISRGDDSGTHQREMDLWELANQTPAGDAYLEVGQGMGPTLIMANEKQGYVLSDMGTYLKFHDKIDLVPLTAAAESLRNPYAAIVVNPEAHDKVNAELANAFVDFLISGEAQRLISDYQINGQLLFFPTRLAGDVDKW